jgi:hypothetical protein
LTIFRGQAVPVAHVVRPSGRGGRVALTWRSNDPDSAQRLISRWCGCSSHRGIAVRTAPIDGEGDTYLTTTVCAAGIARLVIKLLDVAANGVDDPEFRISLGDLELRYARALIDPFTAARPRPSYSFGPRLIGGIADCQICGRPLNDEESVARGIGPVCFKRLSFAGVAAASVSANS